MATPTLKPVDPQAAGWRAFNDYLKRHANIRNTVKTWRDWLGTDSVPDPMAAQLPWVRTMPRTAPVTKIARGTIPRRVYVCPMEVVFEIATLGQNPDDVMAIWGRIEGAAFPDDEAERAALLGQQGLLAQYGIRDVRLIQRAGPTGSGDISTTMARGIGIILMEFWIEL